MIFFRNKSFFISAAGLVLMALLPTILSRFSIYLLALVMTMGLLATSLNMVLGFGGLYQFGHAVFYGIGAYTTALMLTKTALPPWLAFMAAPLMAALFSLLIGVICIRLSKLYFGMLQISLGSLVWAITFRWYDLTGGDDGINGIPLPEIISSTTGSYYFVLAITALCLILMFIISRSTFGRIFLGIRDNPERSAAIGINVRAHQLAGMMIAGFFAGVAGSLFVVIEGSVFPDLMFWTLSLEILIMCLLGGWFTFFGPMVGAAIIVGLQTYVGSYTQYWTMILGVVLMLLIFFLPQGVLGFMLERLNRGKNESV